MIAPRSDIRGDRAVSPIRIADRDAVAVVGPDGTVEGASRAFAERFGYDRAAVIGRPVRELYAIDEIQRFESTVRPTVADGWRWIGDCAGRHRTRGTFVARTIAVGLDDDRIALAVTDGSDRNRAIGVDDSADGNRRTDPAPSGQRRSKPGR